MQDAPSATGHGKGSPPRPRVNPCESRLAAVRKKEKERPKGRQGRNAQATAALTLRPR